MQWLMDGVLCSWPTSSRKTTNSRSKKMLSFFYVYSRICLNHQKHKYLANIICTMPQYSALTELLKKLGKYSRITPCISLFMLYDKKHITTCSHTYMIVHHYIQEEKCKEVYGSVLPRLLSQVDVVIERNGRPEGWVWGHKVL